MWKPRKLATFLMALLAWASLFGCGDGQGSATGGAAVDAEGTGGTGGRDDGEPRVGFELLQIVSPQEIITWAGGEVTQAEFDAIELPAGWLKNQPRELDFDRGEFARSPDASADGEFTMEEHFGHSWTHVATVVEFGVPLGEEGLLSGNTVTKFHTVIYGTGRKLFIIVSPEGEAYVRVSRDFGRTTDQPTIPDSWQERESVAQEELTIQLPNPILNIRTDNEDSYQGPVPLSDLGL